MRVEELRASIVELNAMALRAFGPDQPAAVGALVAVEEEGAEHVLFLAPHGGGSRIGDGAVQVVTPRSPLGLALLGKRAGDECEVRLAGRTRELVIVRVM